MIRQTITYVHQWLVVVAHYLLARLAYSKHSYCILGSQHPTPALYFLVLLPVNEWCLNKKLLLL